ncbi:MAG: nucleotidyltransferase domain-containing protein [Nanoarchaeota archaeon]|nr:nucleotidyltransferase domain-containing protein [Nanoarchaeota archaeon]
MKNTIIKKSQQEILALFRKNIFLSKTIREIALMAKKDYPTVYNAIKELEEKEILQTRKAGQAKLCALLLSQRAIPVLSFLDEQEATTSNIPNIEKLLDAKEFMDDIILVTGSYAKGSQTRQSDIDLAIITKDKAFEKQKLLESLTALSLPRIHPFALTYRDFIGMLLEKEPNFGKEIFNNRLLFRNAARYYLLLKEAVENGFRG